MAVVVTALLAVLVFVFTQSFLKLVLEPVQAQRELIGEVAHAHVFYANVVAEFDVPKDLTGGKEMKIGADREEVEEARKALRELAGRLRASLWTIPLYGGLSWVRWTRRKEDVIEASDHLIGWSNSLSDRMGQSREEHRRIIADRLGITEKLDISRPSKTEEAQDGPGRSWWRRVFGG